MRSRKRGAEKRNISGHISAHCQRLYDALNIGFRDCDEKEKIWHCTDIEIQRHVLHHISGFLDSMSTESLNHPLTKDTVADIVKALEGILRSKYETVLPMAVNVSVKLISTLPNLLLQSHALDLVHPLSSLLSFPQLQVASSCASALNAIISNSGMKKEMEIWGILRETNTVNQVVNSLIDFSSGAKPVEHFQIMASFLSTILWWWPATRYRVWNDAKFINLIGAVSATSDLTTQVTVLKLCSALALCGNGVMKLLENGAALLETLMTCMGSSYPYSVRREGFKLARCLARTEQGCFRLMNLCSGSIIEAIICGMSASSRKIVDDQMSLLVEACRLALITCWPGKHHDYFWKLGIDRVLLDLLIGDCRKKFPSQHILSLKEQIFLAEEVLSANHLLVLRPYIWDVLGWLAIHCQEDFSPDTPERDLGFSILFTCACLSFLDSIHKARHVNQSDATEIFRSESVSRSVLMMVYSPCKYISVKARFVLSELLKADGKECLRYLLQYLSLPYGNKFEMPNIVKTITSLMGLACCSCLPQYKRFVIKKGGIKILLDFMSSCQHNHVHIGRQGFALHLQYLHAERTCCWDCGVDWEGRDIPLLFSLWGLAELLHHSGSLDMFLGQMKDTEPQLVDKLLVICRDISTPGPKWYASYALTSLGVYGFPSKIGNRIGKALNENEHTDTRLILSNGERMEVHGVILLVRSPSLIPPANLNCIHPERVDSSSDETLEKCKRLKNDIRFSAHVNHEALMALLDFVYLGYLEARDHLLKKLRVLAKHCNLQLLVHLLDRGRPKWGAPFPGFDLTLALGPAGHQYSDFTLEVKATELKDWTCSYCSSSTPHLHVHKIVLQSSCDYLKALFQSGMQESHSKKLKVPINWEALVKLVDWLYTDVVPPPPSGCLWDNMDNEEKLKELQPYVELSWVADIWFLDIEEECSRIIVSCLESARDLSVKLIRTAAHLSQWKLAEIAAGYMAPLYGQLWESGDLEELEVELIDMIRAASVRLAQEGA